MACVVKGCKSHVKDLKDNSKCKSFHRFPLNPELREKWVKNIQRLGWVPTKFSRICSLHFEESCYRSGSQRKLLHSYAVPTILPNQPVVSRKNVPKKRLKSVRTFSTSLDVPTCSRSDHSISPNVIIKEKSSVPKKGLKTVHTFSLSDPVASSCLDDYPGSGSVKPTILKEITKENTEVAVKRLKSVHPSSTLHPDPVASSSLEPTYSESLQLMEITNKENSVPRKNLVITDYETKIKQLAKTIAHYKLLAERRGKKLKNAQRKCARIKKKAVSLESIIAEIKYKYNMESDHISILKNCAEGPKQILSRYLMTVEGSSLPKEYPEEVKKFAVTLQFLSPRAYEFVRNTFGILPHPKTIGKWYQTINCEPGFTKESFDTIKKRCSEASKENKTLYCAMSMDEMAIRKHLQWDGHKMNGQITVAGSQDENLPLASEVLVFVITCINEAWKIPVGYFFINGMTGSQKANLIQQCILLLNDTDIKTISLTFDGAAANASMATELGCNLDPNNLNTTFKIGNQEVAILYDPCHNIKLVRNAIAEKKKILDEKGETVNWQYFESLQDLQDSEGLRAANKVTAAHILFQKQNMKVKLATQLLSNSVADSLQFCQQLDIPEFQNCEATVKFIKMFNDLFDILNSRNLAAKGLKKPLCDFNIQKIREKLSEIDKYISALKTSDGTLLVNSRRKTGFLGFKICIKSILTIYDNIFANDANFRFLPTHKLSQDHIEIFFAAIRSLGGYNNNPTAKQFETAYKKLLVHAEFKVSNNANCLPLENISILHAKSTQFVKAINDSSTKNKIVDVDIGVSGINYSEADHDYGVNPDQWTEYTGNIVNYISGYIVGKIKNEVICEKCNELLCEKGITTNSILIKIKNKGGLTEASNEVFSICKYCEIMLRKYIKIEGITNLREKKLLKLKNDIFKICGQSRIFGQSDHGHDNGVLDNHIHLLIKAVIDLYLKIRLHYECRKISTPREYLRNFLTKTITFKGQ